MPAISKKKANSSPKKSTKPLQISKPNSKASKKALKKIAGDKKTRAFGSIKNRGVIHINSLPHGFYEEQLKNYFKQFGHVSRVRVARSKRTGNSKGYAFVEFVVPEVAQIAAETMNNKLMFRKLLKVSYIAPEKQEYDYFRAGVKLNEKGEGVGRFTSKLQKNTNDFIRKQNANVSPQQIEKRALKLEKKLKRLQNEYESLGIDVDTKIAVYKKPGTSSDDTNSTSPELINRAQQKRKTKSKKSVPAKKSKGSNNKLLSTTLDTLLSETIHDDTDSEDSDFDLSDAEAATPVLPDISVSALLNETLNEESSSEDSDFSLQQSDDEEEDDDDDNEQDESSTSMESISSQDDLIKLAKKGKQFGGVQKRKDLPDKKSHFGKKSSAMIVKLKEEATKLKQKKKNK